MKISNKTIIVGVIGNPIAHSKSPEIHNEWAKIYKLDIIYLPILVDNLNAFMNWFKTSNFHGFNVTIPHKESILPYLDHCDEISISIGAVNTVLNKSGKLYGYNTDYFGIKSTLDDVVSKGISVLVNGAGGATRALLYYLNSKNIIPIVKNRTLAKTHKLSELFNIEHYQSEKEYQFDVIINTTPVGLDSDKLSVDLNLLKKKPNFVFDMVYKLGNTALINMAKELKISYSDGNNMLVTQAKHSFEIWTGIYP